MPARLPLVSLLSALAYAAGSSGGGSATALEEGFRQPPLEARLRCYWWWLNSNVTREAITRDLEAMKAKGFAGAIIIDAGGAEQRGNRQVPAGPVFGSDAWRQLYRHALGEASRLGLELSLNILSGWNLGGPGVSPEHAAKTATWSRLQVAGPTRVVRVLEAPPGKLGFYRDVALLAYPLRHGAALPRPIRDLALKIVARESGMSMPPSEPLLADVPPEEGEEDAAAAQVIDISDRMASDGTLAWDVPAGEWEILRFGYTPSGAVVSTASEPWQGLVIDYLSPAAFDSYWTGVVAPLIEDAGLPAHRSLKYLVTDSWEAGGMNWTPAFRAEFRRRRGYDLLPYLPVLGGRIIGSRDASNRFLADFRRTVADLIGAHYALFAERAARHDLGTHPEGGGPHGAPIDALFNLGQASFPQMEFWAKARTHRIRDEERFFGKEAASAAHTYGRTLVGAEGLTSIGPHWEESIWDNLKPSFDRAVCEGVNLLIWHTVTCSPAEMGKPGQEYFAGTHFNPNVTWWEQSGPFLAYINRIQFLMQQGLFVADVLYYYGDHVPSFVRLKSSDPARVLPGYDYDVCNEDVLVNRVSVRDGRLALPDGMSYRVLVLPSLDVISPAALRKVRELVLAGATVVGRKPLRATGLLGDAEVARIASELWDTKAASGARVISDRGARDVLARAGVPPDFDPVPPRGAGQIDYIHRRSGDADIYFVSNQGGTAERLLTVFRVSGKAPELWDPETGAITPMAVFDTAPDGRTGVPLKLDPYGSAVVVFRAPAGPHFVRVDGDADVLTRDGGFLIEARSAGRVSLTAPSGSTTTVSVPETPPPIDLSGPWTVRFPAGWGAPEHAVFDSLGSWTDHPDPGVKHFSGTASYEKDIEIPAAFFEGTGRLELALGDVRELAEVLLNGQRLGVVWKLPRVVDITSAARVGANRLVVRVTNLWPNRLIGDQLLPEAERLTRTNITKFTRESAQLVSGLLGPVQVRRVARVEVRRPDAAASPVTP
jgi:hypothetical protein